jgi:hypothetical protein
MPADPLECRFQRKCRRHAFEGPRRIMIPFGLQRFVGARYGCLAPLFESYRLRCDLPREWAVDGVRTRYP